MTPHQPSLPLNSWGGRRKGAGRKPSGSSPAPHRALVGACDRFTSRIVHFSVQSDHIHLLVEAEDEDALSRAVRGLTDPEDAGPVAKPQPLPGPPPVAPPRTWLLREGWWRKHGYIAPDDIGARYKTPA